MKDFFKRLWKRYRWVFMLVVFLLVFMTIYFWRFMFFTIHSGHAGVLFHRIVNRGTVTDKVYGEGLRVIWPFDKLYIYDIRIQEAKELVRVLSQNGLTVEVNVSYRFYPVKEEVGLLHQKIGVDYQRKLVTPSVVSSVREILGNMKPEEIYITNARDFQRMVYAEIVKELTGKHIVIDGLVVESVKLPEMINDAIEAKLKQEQMYQEYVFRINREKEEAKYQLEHQE